MAIAAMIATKVRAACTASEQNLSQRIALQGPRDELRELAGTFDAMLERLDRAFTSQRQFIANASHELRTPLTVMRTDVAARLPDRAGPAWRTTIMKLCFRSICFVRRLRSRGELSAVPAGCPAS